MAKKFENAAMQFITPKSEEPKKQPVVPSIEEAPTAVTNEQTTDDSSCVVSIVHSKVEKRSRRLQIVLQPSLYKRVKKAASDNNVSTNDYIHQVLDAVTPR